MIPIDLRISFATDSVAATFRACFELGLIQRDPLGTVHATPTDCDTERMGSGATLANAFQDVGSCDVDVVFDGDESCIINRNTYELTALRREEGNFMLDVWVPPAALAARMGFQRQS